MMKKLTALLLCVAMLMVGVVAQAESGYILIKTFLNSDSAEGVTQTYVSPIEISGNKLILVFDFEDKSIALMGYNWQNEGEIVFWDTDGMFQFLTQLMSFCMVWDTIEETMDAGYTFSIWIMYEGSDEPLTIDSKAEADLMIEAIKSAVGN